ncbi:DUF4747 family protein [Stenotrophomonas sepilia]|uniref:DUF4747 family protein n=1 Tax=Stenotrophomonas sepilia TaxID=2860290 RepID=UPI00333E5CAE
MEKVIRVGALNIVTQPHSPKTYELLIQKLGRTRRAGRIRGDRFGLVTLAPKAGGPASDPYVQGLIGTFTRIDVKGDWMNVKSGKVAESDDKQGLSIPANLQPNAKFFRYRFYLKSHVLVFEIGNGGARLTPNNAGALFQRLVSNETIEKEFGEVVCTVFPARDTIEEIINSKTLRTVEFVVHAPNPDTGKKAETAYKERLQRMHALRLHQTVVAKKKDYIQPDEQLESDLRVASTNGQVKATVKKGGRLVKISTIDTPYEYVHSYDGNRTTTIDEGEFGIAADRALSELREG